jgi:uncharacterized membrane protein HdeD (DUF308 family)
MDTSEMFDTKGGGLNELRGWPWALGLGIALVVLGFLALGSAGVFTIGTVVGLGIIMFIAGIIQVAHAFRAHGWKGFLVHLGAGLLYLGVGLMLVMFPMMGAMALTVLLGSFFVVAGSFRALGAISVRFGHWGWACVSGVVTLFLGILILSQWPVSSLWLIGTLLGVDLLFNGASWIALALGVRRFQRRGVVASPAAS